MRVRGWIGVVVLGCAACAPRSAPWPDSYRLAVSREEAAVEAPTFPETTLRVAPVRGTFSAAGRDIHYSLRYQSPVHVGRYGESRWAAPPRRMIGEAVAAWLAAGGHWEAVLGPDDPGKADYVLHLEVLELMQVFPAPREGRAVLVVQAGLRGSREEPPRQERFSYQRASPRADARAAAEGQERNLARLCRDLERWLLEAVRERR